MSFEALFFLGFSWAFFVFSLVSVVVSGVLGGWLCFWLASWVLGWGCVMGFGLVAGDRVVVRGESSSVVYVVVRVFVNHICGRVQATIQNGSRQCLDSSFDVFVDDLVRV